MNILMIGEYPPKIGGISTHIYYLKKELKDHNQNVSVLTYSSRLPKKFRGILFVFFGFFKGLFIIRKNNIDVIHSHFATSPGLLGILLSLFSRKKRILTVHGSDINVYLNRTIVGKLVKFVLSNYSIIIAVSPSLFEKITHLVNGEAILIPNGVDHLRFFPDNSNKKGIGFIGALISEKNPHDFIDFIGELRKREIVEPAYIIGDGYLRKELEEFSKGLNINFLGEIKETEQYLKTFILLVSTSKTEGFGLSILEAMACGTPVVSLPSPGARYLLENLDLIVQDKTQLVTLSEKIVLNSKYRLLLSNKVLEKSKLFTWEKCALENLEAYNKILSK